MQCHTVFHGVVLWLETAKPLKKILEAKSTEVFVSRADLLPNHIPVASQFLQNTLTGREKLCNFI